LLVTRSKDDVRLLLEDQGLGFDELNLMGCVNKVEMRIAPGATAQ